MLLLVPSRLRCARACCFGTLHFDFEPALVLIIPIDLVVDEEVDARDAEPMTRTPCHFQLNRQGTLHGVCVFTVQRRPLVGVAIIDGCIALCSRSRVPHLVVFSFLRILTTQVACKGSPDHQNNACNRTHGSSETYP